MLYPNLKYHFLLFCIFILSNFNNLSAQTDSIALNSRANAATYTNSVDYRVIRFRPDYITDLPGSLKETSGLVLINGQLWTINDGGNPAGIYQVDTANGKVLRTIIIRNTTNVDWESITQDDSSVYIGDFGNNFGNRTDLHILKIRKADLLDPATDTVQAGFIYFSYPDQTEFSAAVNKTNFDCEAFFYHNDSLHLFSKDWSDLQTLHYLLPPDTGTYIASLAEQFDADGLITDASINEMGNIVLLGYKNTGGKFYSCFAWLLSDYKGSTYFTGAIKRLDLGSAFHLGQAEGIALTNNNTVWLSSESILNGWLLRPAKLYKLDFRRYF